MKIKNILFFTVLAAISSSCNWLDIVPDHVATMDMVFSTRNNAEKMLFTCYNYIPSSANPWGNPGIGSSDEVWNCAEKTYYYTNEMAFRIAEGLQNTNDPYLNYWSGGQGGSNLFIGIRDCNTFLDNVHKVPDMSDTERARWIAEAKFIKAYLHIWLFQLYGPIPFVDSNIDVSASPEEVKVVREPVDQVVSKIVALLDEAIDSGALPDYIRIRDTELGRITKPGAMAIKARLLTYAASPLYNGNEDFAFYVNEEGTPMINPVYDPHKWEVARDACKEAIDAAVNEGGHALYEFDEPVQNISETTTLELTLRHTITKKFGSELLWGMGARNTKDLTGICNPPLTEYHYAKESYWTKMMHNPTLGVAEQFYTRNGVPIEEDNTYDYENRYEVISVPAEDHPYIDPTARTARLHTGREPRFYAWIGFDNGKWFNLEVESDEESYILHCKNGELAGRTLENYSVTGFFAKKLVSYELTMTQAGRAEAGCDYPFPIIRLADLYLLYAECLNECKDAPDAEVYEYIQKVRDKAGLDKATGGIVETWEQYSNNPDKPKTKDGMREIIHQERLIELCFEGQRFYDLRRWKLAQNYCNRPIMGWSVSESGDDFYIPRYVAFQSFTPRDYFWPIKLDDIYRNNKLQQSPLW